MGTVGAVAIDSQGNVASATSTGGMLNKMVGRVGDTPCVGKHVGMLLCYKFQSSVLKFFSITQIKSKTLSLDLKLIMFKRGLTRFFPCLNR